MINLTVVAKELGVSKMTLWRWKAKGMPCEQIGKVWKVKNVDQVKEWLVNQRKGE